MTRPPKGPKPKHVPQRTCIACRQVAGKRTLMRLVRTATGVVVDASGKLAGRGAYLHQDRHCWEAVLRGNRLEQALRTHLSVENRQALMAVMASLPADGEEGGTSEGEAAVGLPADEHSSTSADGPPGDAEAAVVEPAGRPPASGGTG